MNRLGFKYISLIFSLLFLSCEKEIGLDVEILKDQLLVLSNFSPKNDILGEDGKIRVTVGKTLGPFELRDSLVTIPDAVVNLYQNDNFIEKLEYNEGGFTPSGFFQKPHYVSKTYEAQPGLSYTISVIADGYAPIAISDNIPEPIGEFESNLTFYELSRVANGFSKLLYELSLDIGDNPLSVDYYHVNIYQEVILYRLSSNGDTVRTPRLVGPLPIKSLNDNQEILPYVDDKGVLIRDLKFSGSNVNFNFLGEFLFNPKGEELGSLIVEVRMTNDHYYNFHSSLVRQVRVQSGFDPIDGPVVIYNQADNGFGVFAGFNSQTTVFNFDN